jgi:hypothetical protein
MRHFRKIAMVGWIHGDRVARLHPATYHYYTLELLRRQPGAIITVKTTHYTDRRQARAAARAWCQKGEL